jgi:S-DNA-T family DNA segregation ATPase FtsK/SpoIIIE
MSASAEDPARMDEGGRRRAATPPALPAATLPVPSGPILEGELVNDGTRRRWQIAQLAAWARYRWRSAPGVPLALKSRQHAVQAGKDAVAALLRSPWRLLGAVARGAVVVGRTWRRWVTVRDFRQAAEEAGKLADKFAEIRELTLFRWKITATVTGLVAAAGLVGYVRYGTRALWSAAAVAAAALAVAGRRKDGNPGRKPVLAGPRSLTWTMDPQVLVDAFRDARLIGKDESLRLVQRATRAGDGWAVTVDLPATRKAADVVRNREALASALAVDELQLVAERVRGNGGHAGRIALWVADSDPYSRPPVRTPLLTAPCWDAWRPVPFGRDARDRRVDLPLVWTSLLIGAIPRQGKTFAARLATAGLVLDPHSRLYVADFKAGKDWDAVARVAYRFMSGDNPEHVLALQSWLVELVAEVQGRYRRMRDLDDTTCPESKITPALSRNPSLNMPVTAVVIDEVQVPLEDRTSVTVNGQRVPAGEYVGELLTWLAKKGPAAGIVLILATQRPDSQTIPSGLRAVLGSRFALRVMDWRDSNIILGEQMNTRGYDSSRLLPTHKGVGILRPDNHTATDALAVTVRTYYMPNDDWRVICERGRTLRDEAGTLTGRATGTEPQLPANTTETTAAISAQPAIQPENKTGYPEPLAAVLAYLGDDLNTRDFIPTAELVEALGVEPTAFGRRMGELGCRPRPGRITDTTGTRQVRGYTTTDLHAAAAQHRP